MICKHYNRDQSPFNVIFITIDHRSDGPESNGTFSDVEEIRLNPRNQNHVEIAVKEAFGEGGIWTLSSSGISKHRASRTNQLPSGLGPKVWAF